MNANKLPYCVVCGEEQRLRFKVQPTEVDVRGESILLHLSVKVCEACGVIQDADGIDPMELAFAEYRKRRDLLTPEQIKAIRERFGLSQQSFAALLGMSEATINRYERGALQDEAHDHAIRTCEVPGVMDDLLRRRGDRLSEKKRRRLQEALQGTAQPGHRELRSIQLDSPETT